MAVHGMNQHVSTDRAQVIETSDDYLGGGLFDRFSQPREGMDCHFFRAEEKIEKG